jgi:hypothetical protein
VGKGGLHLLHADDEVLAEDLNLMEQDQLVHPSSGLRDVQRGYHTPHQENEEEQSETQENSFFHARLSFIGFATGRFLNQRQPRHTACRDS